MTAWNQNITLAAPAGLDALTTGIANLATAANATLDAAQIALDAAKVFLTGTASPQAAAAAALVTSAQDLINDLFGAGFFQVFAHPWQFGVGTGAGAFRSLSFPNAVEALADSLDDQGDFARPQFSDAASVDMIALIAGGPSPAIFGTVLDALNVLIGSKEFKLARRRLDQAFELEAERFTITAGSQLPDWQSVTVREVFPALAPLEESLKESLAMLEGYAAGGESSVDIAGDLIAAKKQHLTDLQTRLTAATALFGGGISGAGVHALKVSGLGGNTLLKAELQGATGAPGQELSFCAGVAWVGGVGTLDGIAGVLGV